MYKLFIDERFPTTNDFVVARSSSEAISYIENNGMPSYISFDHDLGGEDTTRTVIMWLINQIIDRNLVFPDGFSFYVHSQNPIGADWIQSTMTNLINFQKFTP